MITQQSHLAMLSTWYKTTSNHVALPLTELHSTAPFERTRKVLGKPEVASQFKYERLAQSALAS
jgi:hypothetical protein